MELFEMGKLNIMYSNRHDVCDEICFNLRNNMSHLNCGITTIYDNPNIRGYFTIDNHDYEIFSIIDDAIDDKDATHLNNFLELLPNNISENRMLILITRRFNEIQKTIKNIDHNLFTISFSDSYAKKLIDILGFTFSDGEYFPTDENTIYISHIIEKYDIDVITHTRIGEVKIPSQAHEEYEIEWYPPEE